MDNCILGIRVNGLSLFFNKLSIQDVQTNYDYICNIMSSGNSNGNGRFTISIADKNSIQGMPYGNWIIKGGGICYKWGESYSWFTMIDSKGHETKNITAATDKGSASYIGFDVAELTKAIFPKAQEIIVEYPSAEIYNAIIDLKSSKPDMEVLKRYKDNSMGMIDAEKSVDYFTSHTFEILKKYINKFNFAKDILTKSEDDNAAIHFEDDGFKAATTRLTNPDAECTADEVFAIQDNYYNYDGTLIRKGENEYSYNDMQKEYGDTLVNASGFRDTNK